MLVAINMVACGKQPRQSERKEIVEENPFEINDRMNKESVEYSFSFGIKNYNPDKMEINYSGGELKVDFEVKVDGKGFECGPMIFIDGINQEYHGKKGEENKSIHCTSVNKGSNTIETYLKPKVDPKIKRHTIHFLLMFEPEKKYKEGKSLEHAYKITQLPAWDLKIDEKKVDYFKGRVEKANSIKINEKDFTTNQDQMLNNKRIACCFSDKERKASIFGGEKTSYRVCLFGDNKNIKINNGVDYVDVEANGKKGAELNYNLPYSDDDYHILYMIAIPQSNMDTAMVNISKVKVVKGDGDR